MPRTRWERSRAWARAHPGVVTIIGTVVVVAALAIGLWSKRGDFAAAAGGAPLLILGAAIALQIVWLLLRSEAWHVCVAAAGGGHPGAPVPGLQPRLSRQHLQRQLRPRAADRRPAARGAKGEPASVGADRRGGADHRRRGALAAVMSFTLVGPLGLPWWVPLVCLVAAVALIAGLTSSGGSARRRFGTA